MFLSNCKNLFTLSLCFPQFADQTSDIRQARPEHRSERRQFVFVKSQQEPSESRQMELMSMISSSASQDIERGIQYQMY